MANIYASLKAKKKGYSCGGRDRLLDGGNVAGCAYCDIRGREFRGERERERKRENDITVREDWGEYIIIK